MRLLITTPTTVVVDETDVAAVRAEDESGSFGVLAGHTDFLTALVVSVVCWRRADGVLERLASEYVYAQLCEAAMHAFAAENEARMIAMAAARTNIESKLSGLSQREHQLRQEEITTEIVELAAGAEAHSLSLPRVLRGQQGAS
jgi:alternate F1F0 ATPase F1 subunit epsilon